MKKNILIVLALAISTLLFSQNPYAVKAKSSQQKIQEEVLSEEENYIKSNFPFIHMADWETGMRFIAEPADKSSIIGDKLKLSPIVESGKVSYFNQPKLEDYEWKIFTVERVEEREVSCPKGTCIRTYVILNCEGDLLEYEYFGNRDEMRESDVFTSISHLVYLNDIDKARELLLNKKLYTKTSEWYEEDEERKMGKRTNMSKYVPVTIINIGVGHHCAAKVVFQLDNGKEYFMNIKFSGTNVGGMDGVFSESFSNSFVFKNPKNKYPNISTEIWKLIQEGKVRRGMSDKECELSWGKPDDINKTIGSYGVHEQWIYGNQSYLYFENGVLTTIQN